MKYTLILFLMLCLSAKAIVDNRPECPPVAITASNQTKHDIQIEIETGKDGLCLIFISAPLFFEKAKAQDIYLTMKSNKTLLSAPLRFEESGSRIEGGVAINKDWGPDSIIEIWYENKRGKYQSGHHYEILLKSFLEQKK